jgi:hypothetical protein
VPVFAADVKGDLSGICMPGSETHKAHANLMARAQQIGMGELKYVGAPTVFWDVFGEMGRAYALAVWAYRCIKLRADAVAGVPLVLLDRSGAVPVPIDALAVADEVGYILADCRPAALFCSNKTKERVAEAVTLSGTTALSSGWTAGVRTATVKIAELNRQTNTVESGHFLFNAVPAGSYTLTVSKPGYERYVQSAVVVAAGSLADVTVRMKGEFTEMEEMVVQALVSV